MFSKQFGRVTKLGNGCGE